MFAKFIIFFFILILPLYSQGPSAIGGGAKAKTRVPESIWKACWNDQYFDFTQEEWMKLTVKEQLSYSAYYQEWYAKQINQPVEKEVSACDTIFVMRLIPPGKFWMGSPNEEKESFDDEHPKHPVIISQPFWFGKYEVTQEQWSKVTGEKPWSGADDAKENPQHPASYVSWNDIQDKILARMGKEFNIPTEAQWEYACRCGTPTRFYWGEDPEYTEAEQYAWYDKNAIGSAQSVGQKKANGWGLHDISGNVYEWCIDWLGDYPPGESTDFKGVDTGTYRVFRGGFWNYGPSMCRSSLRGRNSPDTRYGTIGLRLMLSLENK